MYIPWQEPAVGQDSSSNSSNRFLSITPLLNFPTASNEPFIIESFSHLLSPSSIGPAVTIIVGIFNLSAAISIPGVILSQFDNRTKPSN